MLSMALWTSTAHAEDRHQPAILDNLFTVETLSPALRELLKQEMQALQKGLQAVIPAYVSADWAEIEHIALKMKNSYIMKQQLSDEQRKELRKSLPHSFKKLDKHFHYLAGMLNHAAKNKKIELVGFYFSQLGNSCVGCHAQFATHRFPAFAEAGEPAEHRH